MSDSCKHPMEGLEAGIGIAAKGLLLDWRYWLLGIVLFVGAALIRTALDLGSAVIYGVSGVLGVYVTLMMSRFRKCGSCSKVVRYPLLKPAPTPVSK